MWKKILGGIAVVLAGFLAFVATRPAHYHVERKVAINAPAEIVYAELEDLRRWAAWSPWDKIDPNLKKTFEGPERGVGQSYTWQGNDEVGKGKMTITSAEPLKRVGYKLEFFEPMESQAQADMKLTQAGDKHEVTWGMDGENNFVGKLFCVFVDMDKMIGKDFEKGLAQLKGVTEAEAEKQRGKEQPAQAAAPEAQPSDTAKAAEAP